MTEVRTTNGVVEIVEVSPRDGLQSEAGFVPTATKLGLIERALAAGITRIEVASFVHPDKVPQMADAEEVMAALAARVSPPDVAFVALVLNRRGLERALAAGVREINVVVVSTDEFGRRNQGSTRDESLAVLDELASVAHAEGLRVTATVSTAFGCPFEGEVPVQALTAVAARAAAAGVDEIALADTIGAAVPADVVERMGAVRQVTDDIALRAHFHNSRSCGLANAYAAVQAGARALDASIGGLGGCPFAPGATGNIATEDLTYLLARSSWRTGLDLAALIAAARWMEEQLGRRLPGQLSRAGPFPPRSGP